jgi:hypothetical protein
MSCAHESESASSGSDSCLLEHDGTEKEVSSGRSGAKERGMTSTPTNVESHQDEEEEITPTKKRTSIVVPSSSAAK